MQSDAKAIAAGLSKAQQRDEETFALIVSGANHWRAIRSGLGVSWGLARASLKRLRDAGRIETTTEYTVIRVRAVKVELERGDHRTGGVT